MKKDNQKIIIGLAILGVAYFGIIRPFLTKIGIQSTAEEKETEKELQTASTAGSQSNPWDPNFWKKASQSREVSILTAADVANRIKKIWDCSGGWFSGDDEACITGQITSVKTQTQVSYLADKFQQKYNTSLLLFLQKGNSSAPWAGLSTAEMATLLQNVKNKPKYRP